MKVRSLKCVSFCPIQVFEDFGITCYNKVRKEVFPYEGGQDMFQLAIIIRLLAFCGICCLCLRRKCFVYSVGVSESQTHLEDWLRDSVFVFPSPSDLCGLVRILLWFEFLSACPVCLAGHSCFKTKKIPMRRLL